jgi:hypothetical protein
VVAEGVETRGILERLRAGCDEARVTTSAAHACARISGVAAKAGVIFAMPDEQAPPGSDNTPNVFIQFPVHPKAPRQCRCAC